MAIITAGLIAGITLLVTNAAWGGTSLGPDEKYDPQVNPADFTASITNPYFSPTVGKKLVYEQETEDGKERIEILVPGWTKEILGVETLVSWYRAYRDGELIEDVRDYYAQHKNGDVWYFGEEMPSHSPLLSHGSVGKYGPVTVLSQFTAPKEGFCAMMKPAKSSSFRTGYLFTLSGNTSFEAKAF